MYLCGAPMRIPYLILFALWPSHSLAEGTPAPGERLFALHCAACHGLDARGTGSIGAALAENPADLTTLAQRNGGRFPVMQAVSKIDGRTEVAAHGDAMPVYAYFFDGPKTTLQASDGKTIETTEAIAQIVFWLSTQQH